MRITNYLSHNQPEVPGNKHKPPGFIYFFAGPWVAVTKTAPTVNDLEVVVPGRPVENTPMRASASGVRILQIGAVAMEQAQS